MEKHHNGVKNNSSKKTNMKASFSLPVTALFLNVIPVLLLSLGRLHLLTEHREYAYSARGKAVPTSISGRKYKRTNIVAAKCDDKIVAPLSYKGSTNSIIAFFAVCLFIVYFYW